MRSILELQKKLAPDIVDLIKKRYTILRQIRYSPGVGRRALASALQMTERVLRAETEFLKRQGLLEVDASGMRLSGSGQQLLDDLEAVASEWFGLAELEERIRAHYKLRQVVVVPGDTNRDPQTKRELGRAGAAALMKAAQAAERPSADADPLVVAVTGGTTLVEVAQHLQSAPALKSALFVPARGGLGERVELQAGTIVSAMAARTGGEYRLMHVPDDVGEESIASLMNEPHIREVADIVRRARIVVHGIGEALVMAQRRRVDEGTVRKLREGGAVAEAFGYYFDRSGKAIHRMPTVGLGIDDIERTETVIAVAGGASKAPSIAAVLEAGHEDVLILDEAAAHGIINLIISL